MKQNIPANVHKIYVKDYKNRSYGQTKESIHRKHVETYV